LFAPTNKSFLDTFQYNSKVWRQDGCSLDSLQAIASRLYQLTNGLVLMFGDKSDEYIISSMSLHGEEKFMKEIIKQFEKDITTKLC
jgi:hypothetical protein